MTDELLKLVELARSGTTDLFQRLTDTLRDRSQESPELIAQFAQAAEPVMRRAAIAAAKGRSDPAILRAIEPLAADLEVQVRQDLAYALTDYPDWPLEQAVATLLADANPTIRRSAVWAAKHRPVLLPLLLERFHNDTDNYVREDIAGALAGCPPRAVLPALLQRLGVDSDTYVQQNCASSIEQHLGALNGYPGDVPRPSPAELLEARRRLNALSHGTYPRLKAWLGDALVMHVDVEQLASFGTLLTRDAEQGRLPRAYHADRAVAAVRAVLEGKPPRAVVLIGEPGCGKTAVINELVYRLREDPEGPRHVLRITPPEFLTGTKYIGEWETRVHKIVQEIRPPRRVILYVPNLAELSTVGLAEKTTSSVMSLLAPYIERGEVTIVGESTSEAFRRGLGADRSLRRLFYAIELSESSAAETRLILHEVAQEAGADMPEPVLDRLGELADFFSTGTVQPGRSVGLLRRVLGLRAGRKGPIGEDDILKTISQSTGIPLDFLDDRKPLDRDALRAFFEARVMGQPEGVEAVVDLVTLIKAGLTDPNKPYGVLLFVGPTGVGKTETALALAEYLFGDSAKMVRLDMSEFATYEGFERLIGASYRPNEPGLLTAAVREKPFSVLLFDEIEKAHENIYNLCLQIFDAGRLTDSAGLTADFRRTIIILTSNVGAAVPAEAGMGFSRQAAPPAPDREMILRDLGRWFRPEFLNRLDRIVTFRPLAVETAEKIARREIVRVLERGGITRRRLAVDVDPEVLPLLLREGYSPTFGARPLKRTVERMVLLPVARAIAEAKVPAGSLLRLVARGERVDIEVEPPEPAEGREAPRAPIRVVPASQRANALLERLQDLQKYALPLGQRKAELWALLSGLTSWKDKKESQPLLDEVYRLDGILTSLSSLEKRVIGEVERLQRHTPTERELAAVARRLDVLEFELGHATFLVTCKGPGDLADALVTLRLVNQQGQGLESVGLLARMYKNFADRRGLEMEVLDDRKGGEPREDTITLQFCGAGAYALLAGETGLHQLSRGRVETSRGKVKPAERDVVRVEVLPSPLGEIDFPAGEVGIETQPLGSDAQGRLLVRPKFDVRLFHGPTLTSVRGWCAGAKDKAIARLQSLLRARIEAARRKPQPDGRAPVVRRYRLGPTTLVRDYRSGRHTGRLDQVLDGHLEMFLGPRAMG
jgi:ATP-dependent Clp protease ATP-binding subunit ClpC